ncbi:MAG: protein kinase, partial [Phycisphaerales bacterium]|nr:protein kinase [Phycisphaerales bacterium]
MRQLGKYTLRRSIGRGGFGEVFIAVDDSTWNLVAVKVLSDHRREDAAARARFELEIRIGTELRHPNILPVIDHALGDVPHFATPLIDGPNLLHLLAKRPMPVPNAVALLRPIAGAVHLAHTHGYLHRDLKPANIVVEKHTGKPFVADFGLAKILQSAGGVTESLAVLGTQPYMPPEQLDPHLGEVSPATDVYGLGATLYHMLTGRPPFPRRDKGNRDLATQITWDPPIPPSRLNPQVPTDLDRVCLLCLQKSPHDRYTSADELAADLLRFEEGKPIEARLPGPMKRAFRRCKRHPRMTVVIAASIALALTGSLVARHFATVAGRSTAQAAMDQKRADTAQAETLIAKTETLKATRLKSLRSYAADMREIAHAWKSNEIYRISALLERHIPQRGAEELRGLEWYYWDRTLRSLCVTFPGDRGVQSVAVASQLQLLATADSTHATLWDLSTHSRKFRWPIGEGRASNPPTDLRGFGQRVAFSRNGRLLAATTWVERDNQRAAFLRVWDTSSGAQVLAVAGPTKPISGRAVVFSPDGRHVIAGGFNGAWTAWDVSTAQVSYTCSDESAYRGQVPTAAGEPVESLRFVTGRLAKGEFWLIAGGTRPFVWSWPSSQRGRLAESEGSVHAANAPEALSVRFDGDSLFLQQPVRSSEQAVISHAFDRRYPVTCFLANELTLIAGCRDNVVRSWSIPMDINKDAPMTGMQLRGAPGPITAVATHDDLVVAISEDGSITRWPGDSEGPVIGSLPIPATGRFQSDQHHSVSSRSGNLVADWKPGIGPIVIKEATTGSVRAEIPFSLGFGPFVEFSSNDQYAAIWANNADFSETSGAFRIGTSKPLVVWDIENTKRTAVLKGPPGHDRVRPCFAPDGQTLAVGLGGAGTALLDCSTGSQSTIPTPSDVVFFCFSPSGRYLAIAGSEAFAVWDIETSSFALRTDRGATQIAFLPDEKHICAHCDAQYRQTLLGDLTT